MHAMPLVVLGGNGSWPVDAVEALLRGHGYRLIRAAERDKLLDVIRSEHPDLVVLSPELRGGSSGFALCRTLRQRRWLATTPVFMLCTDSRADEMSALESGAWDALRCPPDPRALLARVRNAVQTKRQADEAVRQGLIDHVTGCYNHAGLVTRLREEILHARRHKEPLAVFIVALDPFAKVIKSIGDPEASEAAFRTAASAMRLGSRRTDVLARRDEMEFGIIAPSTTRTGTHKLVTRLEKALEMCPVPLRDKGEAQPFTPVMGITVRSSKWSGEEETPETLIEEASQALRLAKELGAGHSIYAEGSDSAES